MEVVTSGLLIERSDREHIPVPLVGVFVQAQLIDLVAEVNIEQRYTNKEKQPIETVYMFSLDEGNYLILFMFEFYFLSQICFQITEICDISALHVFYLTKLVHRGGLVSVHCSGGGSDHRGSCQSERRDRNRIPRSHSWRTHCIYDRKEIPRLF